LWGRPRPRKAKKKKRQISQNRGWGKKGQLVPRGVCGKKTLILVHPLPPTGEGEGNVNFQKKGKTGGKGPPCGMGKRLGGWSRTKKSWPEGSRGEDKKKKKGGGFWAVFPRGTKAKTEPKGTSTPKGQNNRWGFFFE